MENAVKMKSMKFHPVTWILIIYTMETEYIEMEGSGLKFRDIEQASYSGSDVFNKSGKKNLQKMRLIFQSSSLLHFQIEVKKSWTISIPIKFSPSK